jgi:hypothetical protein
LRQSAGELNGRFWILLVFVSMQIEPLRLWRNGN